MKLSKIKKVMVKSADWIDSFEIDSEIFDDFLLEAATRAVEKRKDDPDFNISVVIQAWEKKYEKDPMKHFVYNSYYVMVNAALYKKAEYVRSVYKKKENIDLKTQSLKGDDNGRTKKHSSN